MKRLLLILVYLLTLNQPVSADYGCGRRCSNAVPLRLEKKAPWEVVSQDLTEKEIWAHIVSGEAGGLVEGAYLVAWTLRSWQVYRGMPPELAGPRWGWHGWKEPTALAREAVNSAWNKPMSEAPYEFMRHGEYCLFLGNDRDLRYWNSLGWNLESNFRLEWPEWDLAMNCIWED